MQFELLAPVPAVTLARKLREIPLFRFASVDELFRISTIAQQVRYDERSKVQERGAQAAYIKVLLEGAFEVTTEQQQTERVEPPAMLGFREVVAGVTLQTDATAVSDSIALVMAAEEFRTLLSANIELAQGLFRMLLEEKKPGPDPAPSQTRASQALQAPTPGGELKSVDKVLYLQILPVFERARADELYELAAITRDVVLEPDKVLFSEGHPSSIWLVLAGDITIESRDGEQKGTWSAGDCIGVHEALAGADWSWRARATSAGRALQIERDVLFELLADRMDLLQGIFGAILHNAARKSQDG